MRNKPSAGFTIVELMIATAVFSIILLVVAAGVITFTKQYIKGQTSNQAQLTTAAIMNQVSQDAQFGSYFAQTNNSGSPSCFQIGSDMYVYSLGKALSGTNSHGLVMAPASSGYSCSNVDTLDHVAARKGARELLSPNMRLLQFTIRVAPAPSNPNNSNNAQSGQIYTIDLMTAYGDDKAIKNLTSTDPKNPPSCLAGAGNEYCSIQELHDSVQQRL